MRTTKFTGLARSKWSRIVYVVIPGLVVLFMGIVPFAQPNDPALKVMKTGLGTGTIISTDGAINCGSDCDENYPTTITVELRAVPDRSNFSTFSRWISGNGECSGSVETCTVTLRNVHWVKAEFTLTTATTTDPIQPIPTMALTPEGIRRHLRNHPEMNSPARFVAALPPEYKQNWVLMTRSESLQTGTAESPRILLPSADAQRVFTVGATTSSSYPGSHPNAIEYMQWDGEQKNFRFHEIVVAPVREPTMEGSIEEMGDVITFRDGTRTRTFPARPRGVTIDDAKCSKCHSTQNVLNHTSLAGTTGLAPARLFSIGSEFGSELDRGEASAALLGEFRSRVRALEPPIRVEVEQERIRWRIFAANGNFYVRNEEGTLNVYPPFPGTARSKPNWDAYDSWGGMLPFNRDRIYQGSVEAAAFRQIFNLWNWRTNDSLRMILEQLSLQPLGIPGEDVIDRTVGGANDGQIVFAFDTSSPLPTTVTPIRYSFDRVSVVTSTSPSTPVNRGGSYVLLRHTTALTSRGFNAEGRGVQLFDFLGGQDGNLNAQRIGQELATHRIAPGSVRIDVRPIALAIAKDCLSRAGDGVTSRFRTPALDLGRLGFFRVRNDGKTLTQIFLDTLLRAGTLPRRKADIQRMNLDRLQFERSLDPYLSTRPSVPLPVGLFQQYGGPYMSLTPTQRLERLRQEVFRRPTTDEGFAADRSEMGAVYVDREDYNLPFAEYNTEKVALYRYFLEPLGVSVDKWSMGVRGRSRTYTFADVFSPSFRYPSTLVSELQTSLDRDPYPDFGSPPRRLRSPYGCSDLMEAVNDSFSTLPPDGSGPMPTYTDVQRIFNKSCIECHGGLLYPPYGNIPARPDGSFSGDYDGLLAEHGPFDLSEEELPIRGGRRRRMERSFINAVARISATDGTSQIYDRIRIPPGVATNEDCPGFFMPCGGPALSQADISTLLRWIRGSGRGRVYSEGDPHIRTIDEVNYDFQSAGEFVLLRGENLEIQVRQTPVDTGSPLPPNNHTGLSSCVSLNGAVAVWISGHRITYQPNISGQPDPSGLQLRIDGRLVTLTAQGIPVDSGVRIMQTTARGGIRIESPGGSAIVITPALWDYHQLWHLNVGVVRARATEGVMGEIAPGSWLPALPDGTSLGPKPTDLHQRYVDLYERFEDAWRVTDATTLFDYAPGTSTGAFTIASWPIESPQTCQVPRQTPGPSPRPPLPALPLEAAQQACMGIVAEERKENCIKDVMVLGDAQFAKAYLLTDQIERNASPAVPVLTSPEDYYQNKKIDIALPVTFTWNTATDPDGDVVSYRHCVWVLGELPDNNKCEPASIQASARRKAVGWAALVALLVCLLLLLFLIFVRKQKKPVFLLLVVVTVLVSVAVAVYIRRTKTESGTVSKTISNLKAGKDYSWKVITEDGKGGIAESETRRFKTK